MDDDCILVVLNRHQEKTMTIEIDVHGFVSINYMK